eukprot:3608537-Pleurochrysis_carterae.AAC.1
MHGHAQLQIPMQISRSASASLLALTCPFDAVEVENGVHRPPGERLPLDIIGDAARIIESRGGAAAAGRFVLAGDHAEIMHLSTMLNLGTNAQLCSADTAVVGALVGLAGLG